MKVEGGVGAIYFAGQSLLAMSDRYPSPEAALADIRGLMARSGRVLSLSGLSGVWAGACALVAAALAYRAAGVAPLSGVDYYAAYYRQTGDVGAIEAYVFSRGLVTMLVALAGAVALTLRRSRSSGYELWNATSRALLTSLLVPLAAGGVLVLALWHHGAYGFSAAITLIFYGLALVAGSRYTVDEIRALGYCEIALGLLVAFFPGYGIDAWALGFGVLHIVYGLVMYRRHEAAGGAGASAAAS